MNELLPGLHHYAAEHEGIRQIVHSHFHEPSGTLFDPMPAPDLHPRQIVLSNRHHYRHAGEFGCPVLAPEPGLHEFAGTGREVRGYHWGDELAPGVVALELGAICPDDGLIHLDVADGALLFADGVVVWDGELAFVPDALMDDPETVKARTLERLRGVLDAEAFDHLLFAHGDPIVGGGRAALETFVDAGGRTARFGGH